MVGDLEKQENIWLVKSNNSVLGPFKFDEVVEAIFKGDIHVLDEIKGPFERWRPIRDHSLFNAAIERLKATTYARREYTVTDTVDVLTDDMTQTATNTGFDDTKTITTTGDITASGIERMTPSGRSQGRKATNLKYPLPNESVPEPPKIYPQPQPKPKPASQFPVAFFMTLVLLIGGGALLAVYGTKEGRRASPDRSVELGQLLDDGLRELEMGVDEEAYRYFAKAYRLDRDNVDVMLRLAPLMIQLQKPNLDGGVDGFKLASRILESSRVSDYAAANIIIALGWSYNAALKDNLNEKKDLRGRAAEALKVALNADDADYRYAALVNFSFERIKLGQAPEADSYLRQAAGVSGHENEGFHRYLHMRKHIEQAIATDSKTWYEDALNIANNYPNRGTDFLQEILFLKAYAHKKKGDTIDVVQKAVRDALEIDPDLTNFHVHDLMWNRQIISWQEMKDVCAELINTVVGEFDRELIRGFCAYKQGSVVEADATFQKLVSQRPDDGVALGLKFATEIRKDEHNTAANLELLRRTDIKGVKLAASVLMRDCLEQRDMECARKIDQIYGSKILPLYQFWYAAEAKVGAGDGEFRQALDELDSLSNRRFKYARLLRARQ